MAAVPHPDLKAKLDPKARDRVETACRFWNERLRRLVAAETALKQTSAKGKSVQVRVSVVDGLPAGLSDVIGSIPPDMLELLLHKDEIGAAVPGLVFVHDKWERILRVLKLDDEPNACVSLEAAAKWMRRIFDKIPELDLEMRVRLLNEDVWGCYFIVPHNIEVYWMAIALFAGRWGLREEDMAAVVLAHELVHAYTHIGYDTQDAQWDTKAFGAASSGIIEGLAQYYAETVCRKLVETEPRLLAAFEEMLLHQTGPYVVHRSWFGDDLEYDSEAVRDAMLWTRRRAIAGYDEFKAKLDQAAKELGKERVRQLDLME
jgi:hypothetical protein